MPRPLPSAPITNGVTIIPSASKPFKAVSRVAVTQTAGSAPLYILPVGSPGLLVDQWGNVRGGPNEMIPDDVWSGSTDVTANSVGSIFDFAYLAHTRRIYSRHGFFTEVDNPANLQLGRMGANDHYPYPTTDGTQYGTPDHTKLLGVRQYQTLGKIVFRGGVAKYPGGAAGDHSTFQQESVEIYVYSAEDFIQTADGNHFATGGELYFMTRPTGDSTGLGAAAKPDRFGMDSRGVVAVMGTHVTKGELRAAHLGQGDFLVDNIAYATSDVVARQSVTNDASPVTTRMGAVGPGGEGGIKIGTAPVTLLYGAAAAGGVNVLVSSTSMRANYLALHSTGAAANRVRANYLPSTDRLNDITKPGWGIALGDNDELKFGRAAATAAAPTFSPLLTLSSAGRLTVQENLDATAAVRLIGSTSQIIAESAAAANTAILVSKVPGDSNDRFILRASGTMEWGPGNAATDVALRRNATGVLAVRNTSGTADLSFTALDITSSGTLKHTGAAFGVFNHATAAQQNVTGSRGGNAALASLITALAAYGLVTDGTVV